MKQEEFFSGRWALIIATIGIAVGTGNIWRFSRVVAQNGGGSFLIPWVIFLLLWSVPLLIAEFAIGKKTRYGPIGAIAKTAGNQFAWMGAFIVLVATGIMFYYSVVTGWCLRYFTSAVSGTLFSVEDHLSYWNNFSSSIFPLFYHAIVLAIGGYVIYHGVAKGIERVSKFLVPSLLIILITLLIRAVTLPGAFDGIVYFFTPEINTLLDHKVWLNALTQNAWDTGAGWGLVMTYAIYMKKNEDVSLNAALIGFGNNTVSIIAGITIFSTVFALSSNDAMLEISKSGPANTGLTFIYLPTLFKKFSDIEFVNILFASLFFLALFFAAFSSLISIIELSTRTLIDFGIRRHRAIVIVLITAFLLGAPSALSSDILLNQDWVWGVGLIISGAFISFSIIKYGVEKFRLEIVNDFSTDWKIGKWFNIIIAFVVPFEAVALLLWWLFSSVQWDPEWWNPFHAENAGTCLFQWGLFLLLFIFVNKFIVNATFKENSI